MEREICITSVSTLRTFVVVIMAAIFSLFLGIPASTVLHFTHDVIDKTKNVTVEEFSLKSLFATSVSSLRALKTHSSGGSGGPDGENPHDFKPGRWHLFPSMDYDALFWYDLEWNAPKKVSLFPKNWYEDEELVFAWNSISAKHRGNQLAGEANTETSCYCQGACNCKTFGLLKADTGLLNTYLKHPITREIILLQCHKKYAGKQLYIIRKISHILDMDLNTWRILVDGQPMKWNHQLKQGSLIEVIPRLRGGARSARPMKPLVETASQQYALGNWWQESDDDDNEEEEVRRSLLAETTRYYVPRLSDSWNAGETSDEENLRPTRPIVATSTIAKGTSSQIRTETKEGNKSFERTSKRKRKALSAGTIDELMAKRCCKNNCIKRTFTKEEIVKCRKAFQDLTEEDRRSLIVNFFKLSQFHHNGRRPYSFRVNGKDVCRTAWLRVNSVLATTFHRFRREYENEGSISTEDARKGRQVFKPRTMKAEVWLKDYVEDSADPIPNEDRFCLPTCMTKSEIYNTYVEEMRSARVKPISLPTFSRMWTKKFQNVIIPKENKFTKCGVCVALKLCLQGTTDKDKRMSFAYKRKLHNEQQMAERRAYYRNCLKAEVSPKQYLSLIIDGMDQSKTNLPHANCLSKDETYHFLRTHITGAISHGSGRIFTFIDLMRWPHDSNLTLNVLLRVFLEIAEEGQLPPDFCLQLDNCYRECKNKFIFGFCALLVEKEIFKEVYVSFLMVGHTHEDIDQFFSRISKRLRRMDSMTLPELKKNVRQAHTPAAETHIVDFIFDIKKWIEPCLNTIKNHVYPHAYKFMKINGRVVMKYKQWANDEKWQPEGSGLHVLAKKPEGIPPLVRPQSTKMMDVSALDDCVKKCRRLTAEQRTWWADFLAHERRYRAKWSAASEDYLSNARKSKWYFEKLKKHKPISELRKQDQDQEERERNLENLLYKANQCPKVVVGEKRKKSNEANPPKKKKKTK